jgi:hypothetical protein
MAGNRSRRRALLRNIERWFNGREDNSVDKNDVERSRKMINHKINGWSSAFEDDPKKRKRMRRLWFVAALLIGSSAYFTIDYVKKSQPNPFLEAEEPVRTEEVTKDSTSVKTKAKPASEVKKETIKYTPDGEVLIERPEYPKRGFNSSEEAEEFHKLLNKYNEQQKKINEWKAKGNSVFIYYKDRRIDDYLNSLEEDEERFII